MGRRTAAGYGDTAMLQGKWKHLSKILHGISSRLFSGLPGQQIDNEQKPLPSEGSARKGGILLVTEDTQTKEALNSTVRSNGSLAFDGTCGTLNELVVRLKGAPAAVVLIDIDPNPTQMLQEMDCLTGQFPTTRFIILSSVVDNDLLFEAMRIGARHLLLKSSISTSLAEILRKLIPNGASRFHSAGSAITILSAAGGCGATTVAVNLANELRLLTCRPVLLVDLDFAYGAVAACLSIKSDYGLADVLRRDGQIDPQLISSTATAWDKNLRVLASPASTNHRGLMDAPDTRLIDVLEACKQAYEHTVVDAPRVSMETAARLALSSKVTLVVFQQNVKDVRAARDVLASLQEHGVSPDSVLPVANRFNKRHQMVSLQDSQRSLGRATVECLSNDFRSVIKAINYGQPLAQAAPLSHIRRDIRRLATKVSNNHINKNAGAK